MKIFKDRQSAGKILANRLKNTKAELVLGIPRGGVVVAKEVAEAINLPLDVVITRKIGAPNQPELALGAVDPDGEVVGVENLKLKIDDEMQEIKRREELYRQGRGRLEVQDRIVILVDDGMATGATTLAAVRYLKRHGAKVILAVPVAPQEAVDKIRSEVDEAIFLEIPEYFQAVGQFYQSFDPVSDEEVVQYLK